MSCCSSSDSTVAVLECPQCGISCKHVSMKTIFHQVKFPEILDVDHDNYHYCADKICSVGYFSKKGKTISKDQLRSFTDLENNKICYCFDINTEQYVNSLKEGKAETIKKFVIQKTKVGDCACEIRNPSGQCCLASFKRLEKSFKLSK